MSPLAVFSLLALLAISAHAAEDIASATIASDHHTTKVISHAKKVTELPVHDIKDVTDAPIGMSTYTGEPDVPTTVIDSESTTVKFHGSDSTTLHDGTTTRHPVRSSGMVVVTASIGTVLLSLL